MTGSSGIPYHQPVPLFPLGSCVLLPHGCVPLHIFEPRYRAMTRDAIDGRGLIAMACFQGEHWKTDYEGTPPIEPVVCVGRVVKYHCWEDGRYNLLLQGLDRARVVQELVLHKDGYRLAQLESMETVDAEDCCLSHERATLEELLKDPSIGQLAVMESLQNVVCPEMPTNALVDVCTLALCTSSPDRYAMLAQENPCHRIQWLIDYLRKLRSSLQMAQRQGRGMCEDGLGLN